MEAAAESHSVAPSEAAPRHHVHLLVAGGAKAAVPAVVKTRRDVEVARSRTPCSEREAGKAAVELNRCVKTGAKERRARSRCSKVHVDQR